MLKVKIAGHPGTEPADAHIIVQEQNPKRRRLKKVVDIRIDLLQLGDPLDVFGIHRVQFFVDALGFFVVGLQFFVGGDQLLVCGLQFLVRGPKILRRHPQHFLQRAHLALKMLDIGAGFLSGLVAININIRFRQALYGLADKQRDRRGMPLPHDLAPGNRNRAHLILFDQAHVRRLGGGFILSTAHHQRDRTAQPVIAKLKDIGRKTTFGDLQDRLHIPECFQQCGRWVDDTNGGLAGLQRELKERAQIILKRMPRRQHSTRPRQHAKRRQLRR